MIKKLYKVSVARNVNDDHSKLFQRMIYGKIMIELLLKMGTRLINNKNTCQKRSMNANKFNS